MNKFIKLLIPVSVLAISVFTVQALVDAKPTPEKKPKEQRVVSLYVDEVTAEKVNLSVSSQGEVKPHTEIDLTALVSGQIISISDSFAEGAAFTNQQTLIKIDDTEYKLAIIRAQSKVASAKVMIEKEKANSKIKEEQWKRKNNNRKPSDYALNIPQVAEAKAQLLATQADLKQAQLNLSRTEIKAPFQGRVQFKNIGIGQYITPSSVLGHIFSTDVVEIRLPLTDFQLSELNLPMGFEADENNAPKVDLSASIAGKIYHWQGSVVRTNATIDQDSRLIYVTAEVTNPYALENPQKALAVGMYVNATIDSQRSQDTLIIPRIALHGNNKVYIINDSNKLEIRKVSVLSTTKDIVYVASGIKAGEKVVTSSAPVIVDGMSVKALKREKTASQLSIESNKG